MTCQELQDAIDQATNVDLPLLQTAIETAETGVDAAETAMALAMQDLSDAHTALTAAEQAKANKLAQIQMYVMMQMMNGC